MTYIIIRNMRAAEIIITNKMPVRIRGEKIRTELNPNIYRKISIWRKRSPANIVIIITPLYPGRSPLIIRYPYPAVIIIIVPPAVMIGYPSKRFIRIPVPAIICPYPLTISIRRPMIANSIRAPNR